MATEAIVTVPFRLAFPEVFAPRASVEGGKAKYSITLLYPKDGQLLIPSMPGNGILELRKLAFAAVKDKWGEDRAKWPPLFKTMDFQNYLSTTGKDGWPLRDGASVEWDGFRDMVFVRAASQYAPGIVDARLQAIIDKSLVFGGLIARAQINAYGYDEAGNKGVTFGLNNLQLLKDDGTRYDGRQDPKDVFEAFGDAGGTTDPFGAGSTKDDPFK